jgi:enterochelin esterase-like enzyme
MSGGLKASRVQIWFEGAGEWSWPGQAAASAAVELLPPAWIPASPPRLHTALAGAAAVPVPDRPRAARARGARSHGLGAGALLSALAAACVAVAINGPAGLERAVGIGTASAPNVETLTPAVDDSAQAALEASLPTLTPVSEDAAGSSILSASYPSKVLGHEGSFLVYLPPGYASTTTHYPVLYLLHGHNEYARSFLQLGLQGTLDQLISSHTIQPMIAVMIQGGSGSNNWRDLDGLHYESYVVEVQRLIDEMLPTLPDRADRTVAGYSMGGYGSLNVALSNPELFSVAESWCGFFNGLEAKVHADRATLARLGMHAFLYGAAQDTIANPAENAPFAAELRANGVSAESAIYPGGHTFETFHAHLEQMLIYAANAMAEQHRSST